MRLAPTLLVVCLATATARGESVGQQADAPDKTILLKDLVQKLLANMGPISVPDGKIDVDVKEVKAKGSFSGLTVTGVSSAKVERLSVVLEGGSAALKMSLPSVELAGDYGVDGKLSVSGITLPLQGEGKLTASLTNFSLETSLQLGISDEGRILLKGFELSAWNLDDVQLHLDGLYGDSALGKTINKLLADTLTKLVKAYHDKITDTITKAVTEQGASLLYDLHKDHSMPTPFGLQFPVDDDAVPDPEIPEAAKQGVAEAEHAPTHDHDIDVLVHLPEHGEVPHTQLLSLLGRGLGTEARITLEGPALYLRDGVPVEIVDQNPE